MLLYAGGLLLQEARTLLQTKQEVWLPFPRAAVMWRRQLAGDALPATTTAAAYANASSTTIPNPMPTHTHARTQPGVRGIHQLVRRSSCRPPPPPLLVRAKSANEPDQQPLANAATTHESFPRTASVYAASIDDGGSAARVSTPFSLGAARMAARWWPTGRPQAKGRRQLMEARASDSVSASNRSPAAPRATGRSVRWAETSSIAAFAPAAARTTATAASSRYATVAPSADWARAAARTSTRTAADRGRSLF